MGCVRSEYAPGDSVGDSVLPRRLERPPNPSILSASCPISSRRSLRSSAPGNAGPLLADMSENLRAWRLRPVCPPASRPGDSSCFGRGLPPSPAHARATGLSMSQSCVLRKASTMPVEFAVPSCTSLAGPNGMIVPICPNTAGLASILSANFGPVWTDFILREVRISTAPRGTRRPQ